MDLREEALVNLKGLAYVEANITQEVKILQLEQQLAAMKLKLNDLTGAELGAYQAVGDRLTQLELKLELILTFLKLKVKE